jgi:regulator of protease activity HflC (stomatin/prohibitin superfamily)
VRFRKTSKPSVEALHATIAAVVRQTREKPVAPGVDGGGRFRAGPGGPWYNTTVILEALVGGVLSVAGISLLTGFRVLREYERALVFRLGRARTNLAGPGVVFLLPFGIDRARVVDTRIQAIQIPPQEVITRDNISIVVSAVVYANVSSPRHAILEVDDFLPATLQLAATTLRAVVGKMELDDILANRDGINTEVRSILDTRTEQWGVEITAVELKDIELPREMQRAMARQAEAERERRAKVIAAEGEVQAAAKLAEAARVISSAPAALQLRLYQTLVEVSSEARSTIVFPVPIDLSGGGYSAPPQQQQALQNMMQSTVALATAQEAKQLAESPEALEAARQRLADKVPSRG